MLDIGVGNGRTAFTFAALCATYLGIDYAPAMVANSRREVGEDERVTFAHADARDLVVLDRTFDVVLFSFNGIDSVAHADRARVLSQIHAVLRPAGTFLFSSHSIDGLPLPSPLAGLRGHGPSSVGRLPSALARAAMTNRVNRTLDLPEARRRGWTMVRDGAHRFQIVYHYVTAGHQAAQLQQLGFVDVEVLDMHGVRVDPKSPGVDPWLHYLCRKPAS